MAEVDECKRLSNPNSVAAMSAVVVLIVAVDFQVGKFPETVDKKQSICFVKLMAIQKIQPHLWLMMW